LPEEQMMNFIELFWWTAQRLLYPKVSFSPGQHNLALSIIRKHVYYQGNKPWDNKMWRQHHEYNIARLQLVNRYLSRPDPEGKERFVPMPHVYFDSNNTYGFEGTKEWSSWVGISLPSNALMSFDTPPKSRSVVIFFLAITGR
jgi:hypothetical protein